MNYYGEEERRKLNELLSSGAISSDGAINGIPNQTLAALMADNSEQGVQFNPTFQQGEMDRNREQFAREDVRAAERGYNPQQFQTPQAPVQPAAPATPQPQNFIQRSGGEKISLDQFAGNRPHDPFRDGPEILGRQRTPDGGEMIIKRVAGLDGFGRQSARVVQEFVPPPDMGRMKQAAEIQKLQAETRKADRIESPKADWGTVESGGKMYQINKNTGEIRPATAGDEQLVGKEGKKLDPVAKREGALMALTTAGYDPETGQDRVEALINQSTSGGAQKGGAAAARFFDVTTSGGKAIQALKTISNSITLDQLNGKLGAGISNADVEFLKKTVGDVANEDLTAEERLTAWKEARSRLERFAEVGKGKPAQAGSTTQPATSRRSFATEAEALRSGVKGEVTINGRRARLD